MVMGARMRAVVNISLFFLLSFPVLSSQIVDGQLNKALKKTGIEKKNVGIAIYDLKKDKMVYALNEDKLFSIASVNKLLVTAASLKYLGQDFRFKTTIYGEKPDSDGVIKGDLCIKGAGDPLFVSENMWYLVNTLKNMGVKSIEGNIILDDTLFPAKSIYDENGDRAYSAKVSALSVNFNSLAVNIVSGKDPYISMDPEVSNLILVDKTEPSRSKTDVEVRRIDKSIIVSGKINDKNTGIRSIYRNIDDPAKYFEEVLRLHLSWRNIGLKGRFIVGKRDQALKDLFVMESRRLNDILVEMNKFSNNFIAEQLMRALVYKVTGSVDENALGRIVGDYLEDKKLNPGSFEVVNASGFSRMNRSKPADFVKFLAAAYNDFHIGPEFINSLPISGVDGTIRRSLGRSGLRGNIRAKTGTLSGIRSLAGYMSGPDAVYAFIIVSNDRDAYKMMDWEGDILEPFIRGEDGL